MSRAFFILLAALLAGCDESPTALPAAGGGDPVEAGVATDPPGQERHIHALVAAGEAAWAAKDPAGYAALFAEDAEFISPIGTFLHGREAIRAQHVLLFGGPFAGSTQDLQPLRIDFLTGTVAVVDLGVTLTGYQLLPPGLVPTEPGVLRLLARWVVVKHEAEWLVVAHQMTQVQPTP